MVNDYLVKFQLSLVKYLSYLIKFLLRFSQVFELFN
jgi:hypothetical protein